jgi:2-dehydropantoate 2-reductase
MVNEILIVGSGAMATLFAARLSAGGAKVSILGTWPEGLAAFKNSGAILTDGDGREHIFPVDVLSPDHQHKEFSYALVLVKSWQTCQAASILADWLKPDGICLTLQNGLGNRECLEKYLGANRAVMGVTTTGGTLLEPGHVISGGEGIITIEKQPGLEKLTRMLQEAGFEIKLVDDAKSLIWGKLVINAAINPLSAILRVKNGQLLENKEACDLMEELAIETSGVAKALGIGLPYGDPVEASREVARRTASNNSSMLQDVLRGAPTEIEAINGAIWKLGNNLGIPTPANAMMTRLIRAIVSNPTKA